MAMDELKKPVKKYKYTEYQKQFREEHKDYFKEYYDEHKEEYKKKEICNICYSTYSLWNKGHHIRSKRHINAIELNETKKLKKELDELKSKIQNLL